MQTPKKVLLLYISVLSGHHRAAMAIEKALHHFAPNTQVYSINAFHYTNPILERIINKTYNGIIKRTPEVWEYLYDNPKVVKNTQALKEMMHRYNSLKMKNLIDDFKPDVVACTQAFPCGMVADYKTTFKNSLPLMGVLTDFYPHSYWMYDAVDIYTVASQDAKDRFVSNGIPPEKIQVTGIPIDIKFSVQRDKKDISKRFGLDAFKKTVLIMGGSGGLGPIKKVVFALNKIRQDIQIIVVSGTNSRLNAYLNRRIKKMNKRVVVINYADNIDELMSISDIIITKPGGLTISEALAKTVPIIIINPIPGQESKNAEFLLKEGAAVKALNERDAAILVDNLCSTELKLESMKRNAQRIAMPYSAINTAKTILEI
jgi:processive 1,2-diacylglycerol beta-glucosyltransferase